MKTQYFDKNNLVGLTEELERLKKGGVPSIIILPASPFGGGGTANLAESSNTLNDAEVRKGALGRMVQELLSMPEGKVSFYINGKSLTPKEFRAMLKKR